MNRWIMLGLVTILSVEVFGFVFLQGDGYACPGCNGTKKVWREGFPFMGIPGHWETCPTCQGTGWYWMYSLQGATAISFLACLLCFLAVFSLAYAIDGLRADMNPYVYEVENMDWPFNPMYSTWLFVKDRRKWTFYYTVTTLLTAILGGVAFSVLLTLQRIAPENLWWSFVASATLMVLVAFCWYQGVCKPMTEPSE